jgi:uncharacterized protein (DUF983 family)
MMKNRNALQGILAMRCPRCREGKMFPEGTLYTSRFMTMNDHCSSCGQSFMPEPGYYFGAMFVSYGLNAAYFVAVWVATYVLFGDISVWAIIAAILFVIIVLLPVTLSPLSFS